MLPESSLQIALKTAYSLFIFNFCFGLLVKFKIVDNTRFRFLHHAIYFFVMCGVIAATVIAFLQPSPQRLSGNNLAVNSVAYSLAVLTAMLLLMIRFRGRTAGHWMYALVCLSVYSVIVFTSI